MKSLGFRGAVLLALVLTFAVPVFASQPTEVSGYGWLTGVIEEDGEPMAVAQWNGTFEGELKHAIFGGRAVRAEFHGTVAGREGDLDMIILKVWGDPTIMGYHGRWVIEKGYGELENLRGEGTFKFEGGVPAGPYAGEIHFDPE